jgi:DNA polymerase elongation subunit (family B)
VVKRAQGDLLRCLAKAHSAAELRTLMPEALAIIRAYRDYLREGSARLDELVIATSVSQDPRAYQHRTRTALAAHDLLAHGVRLQPGETIHYVITDATAPLAADRVRAAATLDGTCGYDPHAYDDLLVKAALAILAPLGYDRDRLQQQTDPLTD